MFFRKASALISTLWFPFLRILLQTRPRFNRTYGPTRIGLRAKVWSPRALLHFDYGCGVWSHGLGRKYRKNLKRLIPNGFNLTFHFPFSFVGVASSSTSMSFSPSCSFDDSEAEDAAAEADTSPSSTPPPPAPSGLVGGVSSPSSSPRRPAASDAVDEARSDDPASSSEDESSS
ncbi:hypothetical protein B0H13DRAFT_2368457 [Mycena leptocephala]|nr:hypothetical protein B0H13DRAFT_2368457 [Mycena leptocephala]